jgi:hypothetical protein
MISGFFYKTKLDTEDFISLILYSLFSLTISYLYLFEVYNQQFLILFYGLWSNFYVYMCCYKLRKLNFTLILLAIGIIHFTIYLFFRNNLEFLIPGSIDVFVLLRNTIPLVLFVHFLRFIKINITSKELLFGFYYYDGDAGETITLWDWLFGMIYVMFSLLLAFIDKLI